jgi:hypothetical protein
MPSASAAASAPARLASSTSRLPFDISEATCSARNCYRKG